MSKRDNLLLILDMLDAAQRIQTYTEGLDFDRFIDDQKTLDAVVRNFEIIGEASTRIHPDFQIQHAQIPWKHLRGYRNRLIHEYFGVDYQINSQIAFKSDFLLNITDLDLGRGRGNNDTNIMPGLTFGGAILMISHPVWLKPPSGHDGRDLDELRKVDTPWRNTDG